MWGSPKNLTHPTGWCLFDWGRSLVLTRSVQGLTHAHMQGSLNPRNISNVPMTHFLSALWPPSGTLAPFSFFPLARCEVAETSAARLGGTRRVGQVARLHEAVVVVMLARELRDSIPGIISAPSRRKSPWQAAFVARQRPHVNRQVECFRSACVGWSTETKFFLTEIF